MQDSRGFESLADKGWEGMREILDREMPRRRRRFIWVLLPGLLIAAGIAGLAIHLFTSEYRHLPLADPTEAPESTTERANHSASAGEKSAITSVNTVEGADAGMPRTTALARERSADARSATATTDGDAVHMNASRQSAEMSQDLPVTALSTENRTEVSAAVENDAHSQPLMEGDARELLPHRRSRLRRADITVLERVPLTTFTRDLTPGEVEILAAKKGMRLQTGAFLFGHIGAGTGEAGFEAGVNAAVRLGSRWSLGTGLSYGELREVDLFAVSNDELSTDFMDPATPDSSSTLDPSIGFTRDLRGVGYDTARTLVDRRQYLNVPLMVEYRVVQRLYVSMGGRVSYLLNAPLASGSSFAGNIDPGTIDLRSAGVLNRWDVALAAGLRWNFSARAGVVLRYQHGLIPYLEAEARGGRQDVNRTVSLGLHYVFW